MKKILLFIVVFLAVLAIISYVKTHIPTLITAPPHNQEVASCDMSLWAHVYRGRFSSAEDRLQVINPCLTVTGTVINARAEADGDWHVQLDVDSQYRSLLNQANLERQQGYLVLEPMCSNYVSQKDTIEEGVCDGFSQQIFDTELVGQRVTATGAYVIDMQHGWMELHPVTSIVPIQ
jgi:hypothetical protein